MPTLAIGNSHGASLRCSRGFTLVETLVVVLIVGLLAGTVAFTAPGTGGRPRDDARKLAARTTLIGQESIVSGLPMGLKLTHEGYAFFRMDAGVWKEMTGERAFQRHTWSPELVVQVGHVEKPHPLSPTLTGPAPETPNVVFDPTGLSTPFIVSLASGDEVYVVSKNEKGEVVVRAAQ